MTKNEKTKKLNKKQYFEKIFLIIFIISTTLISFTIFSIGKNLFKVNESKAALIDQLHNIVTSKKKIKGEKENRTNILLLGMGGEGHEGAQLTDTIIVASIEHNPENKKIALISIPRDLYVNLKNQGNTKINNIYALDKQTNSLISKTINNITGLPIHYYIQVDFEGFQKVIDTLGGIDINIERSFYDPMYPTDNFGYQTISFEQGTTHMNGDLALKYARSRHGIVTNNTNGYEASDFARSKRQQQILFSVKEKILSIDTIINPNRINELLRILGDHVKTNLQLWEIIKLINFAKNFQTSEIQNYVLDDSPNGLLYASTTPDGSFVFLPKSNNFLEIHDFCQNIFESKNNEEKSINIEILNGTTTPGLASKAASAIPYENINIINLNNAKKTNYKKTIIYNYNNSKPNITKFLKNRFNAKIIKTQNPQNNPEIQSDITIIIGKNFLQLPLYEY